MVVIESSENFNQSVFVWLFHFNLSPEKLNLLNCHDNKFFKFVGDSLTVKILDTKWVTVAGVSFHADLLFENDGFFE
jgi:hypothetical protein